MLGGLEEYAPYLSTNATFGRHKKRTQWVLNPFKHQSRGTVRRRHQRHGLTAQSSNEDDAPKIYEQDDDLVSYQSESHTFDLPYYPGEMLADESLHFELICTTRDFGVPEINERQSKYAETQNTGGEVQLELYDLMKAYLQAGRPARFSVERPVLDLKLVRAKALELRKLDEAGAGGGGGRISKPLDQAQWNVYVERAAQLTSKGTLRFEVTFRHLDLEAYQRSCFGISNLKTHCTHARDSTALQESAMSLGEVKALHKAHLSRRRRHQQGLDAAHQNSSSSRNQLRVGENRAYEPLLYTSQPGQDHMARCREELVYGPYLRHYLKLNAADPEPVLAPLNENTANLQLPIWNSKAGELPVPCYWSSADVMTREYASEAKRQRDLAIYGFDARSEKCLMRMLRSSLRRHGLSETRFNQVIAQHFSLKNRSRQIDPLLLVCEEALADVGTFAANSAYYTADYRFMPTGAVNDTGKCTMMPTDSWDGTLVQDEGRGDDCEGMDHATMVIIRSFLHGRVDLVQSWHHELLRSARLLLQHSVLIDLGATVTSAYFDNNAPVDLKKEHVLCKIDSPMDRKARCAGHCHGLFCPLGETIQRLENGNLGGTEVLKRLKQADLQDDAFKARDAQRSILVLEPTGSIEPRILPVEESYACSPLLCRKKKAERYFLKALRTRIQARKDKEGVVDISGIFTGEGVQHYVELREPDDSISPFYRELAHGCSVDLWKRPEGDISMAQFSFAKKNPETGRYTCAVKIADYIRHPEQYSLYCEMYDSRHQWERQVKPLMETVQHQLPIASFARYTDEKYETLHSSYHAPGSLNAKYDLKAPRPESPQQRSFEKLAASVCDNENLAIVRLQSRHWSYSQSEEKTRELQQFLSEMPGLVEYAFYTEHQLPVCDPFVEILCVVDVKKCMAMEEQAQQKSKDGTTTINATVFSEFY